MLGIANEDIWVALTNPNKKTCQNAACTGELFWNDPKNGTFVYAPLRFPNVTVTGQGTAFKLSLEGELRDDLGTTAAFFCQSLMCMNVRHLNKELKCPAIKFLHEFEPRSEQCVGRQSWTECVLSCTGMTPAPSLSTKWGA